MARRPQSRHLKPVPRYQGPSRELSASERGYDNYWTTVIAPQVRERDEGMCQRCLREGGLALAMEEMMSRPLNSDGSPRQPPVGHKKPGHVCSEEEFYSLDNLEVLCDRHNRLQAIEDVEKYGAAPRTRRVVG